MSEVEIGICQTAESAQGLTPSLADKAPAVLQRYFDSTPTFLTQHHVNSYESAVFREIPELIFSENPIVVLKEPLDSAKGIYKYKTEIFIGGNVGALEDLGIDVGPPIITLNGGKTVRRMFPNEARLRNLTYAAQFRADILIRLTFTHINERGEVTEREREIRVDGFPLFRIPILLRSRLCATHGAGVEMLREMGECSADQGGYFIIDGSEKVLITRQEQALNSVFVSKKPPSDLKVSTYATVVSQHPTTRRTNRVALYRLRTMRSAEAGPIRVSIPFVKGAVPLFVIFRALGVESDEEIVRMIVPTPNRVAEDTLITSIHDAWPVTTQALAIEFLRTLTKGFITAHVLDILHQHLFAHVLDRPLAKAQYLAEIIRKIIRVENGEEPATNRDDIRNQRLLPTGTLLRGLFGECWKDWKKAVVMAVDTQYNYNRSSYQDENFLELFVPANLPKILSTGILNDALMRGFRGKWGTSSFNMKDGVIQPLARISYLDAVSHTRRVVSDFDTGLKLTGPRQLHTSQVGYFCTSETPTGAHIGATKNLSILTAISVDIPAAPVIQWLLERGGVVEVAAAPRWMMASAISVQVNGGTVGFTQQAGELVYVLKLMKWTGCLSPMASVSFNTADRIVRIYLDDGRPLRPLWHLAGGKWPKVAKASAAMPSWRDLVLGDLPETAELPTSSVEFTDPLASAAAPTLAEYVSRLEGRVGAVEYVDPYEGNEAYIHWWGAEATLTADHTHAEIHPSTLMGILASMIPFANHNQSPRNQLSCSQSKQAIGYYARNYENRFDTYGSMLCYGEGALCRTIVHDAVAGGAMPYGTNLIFAFNCHNGYNQDDGILFNRSSVERGLFRSLALRSYETVEEEDAISGAMYRVGNPRFVLAWTDLKPGNDYSQLDDQGIIREGAFITEKTVLVGRYMMLPETGKVVDSSLLPTVFTKGRVDKVVVLHQANGLRLVKVRIIEERVPELGDKYCMDDTHEVLTANRGWVSIAEVSKEDVVAQLNKELNQLEYVNPLEVMEFDHKGEMYEVETQGVSQCVTMNHRMWVKDRYSENFALVKANDMKGKRVKFQSGASPIVGEDKPITLDKTYTGEEADAALQLLGIWFAEGWTYIKEKDYIHRLEIAANKPRVQKALIFICDKLKLRNSFGEKSQKWRINSKELSAIFSEWSVGAVNKSLPKWALSLSARQSRILLEAMCLGDGHESKTALMYFTSSVKLRDDVQILAQHAGWTASYKARKEPEINNAIIEDGNGKKRHITPTTTAWCMGIHRSRMYPTLNHGHCHTQSGQLERVFDFDGKVYCIRVPSEVFLVRRNGRCSFTGNSSRHGQKGTMGMLIDAVDMPRTADGMVPDVLINPHCIPSRMTMAQMLEQLFGKMGAVLGTKINATSFMNDDQSLGAVSKAMEMAGLHPMGEEILYSGMTGQMFTSSIFMGPLNFMRLKHLAQDKINARGAGRKEMRTHQPTGGRGNEGGMRIGEMERDVLIAHGITDFLTESMMKRSDGTEFWVCNGCGTIPIVNEAENLFVCSLCDGPLEYKGVSADTINMVLPVKKSRCTFSKVAIPYAAKLLDQELTTFMNAGFRYLTAKTPRRFHEPTEVALTAEEEAALKELDEAGETLLEVQVDEAEKKATKVAAQPKLRTPQGPSDRSEDAAEDGAADVEDEGQPAKNEGPVVVAPPAGEASVDFDAKQNKEFSSYFAVKITIDDKVWPTTEHYFQAMKFPSNPEYQEQIRLAKTPAAAKKLGKTADVPTRPDWMKVRESVMLTAVRAKFQIPALKAKLLATGKVLMRDMSPQDNFWGVGRSGKGQNKLGKILMRVREELAAAAAVEKVDGPMLEAQKAADAVADAAAEPVQQPQPQEKEILTGPPGWSPEGQQQPEIPTGPPGWSPEGQQPEAPVIDIADIPAESIPTIEVAAPAPPKEMVMADGTRVADMENSNIKIIKM
jgi:DNA-directed RNA polymerase II subunit RPB2